MLGGLTWEQLLTIFVMIRATLWLDKWRQKESERRE